MAPSTRAMLWSVVLLVVFAVAGPQQIAIAAGSQAAGEGPRPSILPLLPADGGPLELWFIGLDARDRLVIIGDPLLEIDALDSTWHRLRSEGDQVRWEAVAAGRSSVRLPFFPAELPQELELSVGVKRRLNKSAALYFSRSVVLRKDGMVELSALNEAHLERLVRLTPRSSFSKELALDEDELGRVVLAAGDPRLVSAWAEAEHCQPHLTMKVQVTGKALILDSVSGNTHQNANINDLCSSMFYMGAGIPLTSVDPTATITGMDIAYDVYHPVDVSRFEIWLFRGGGNARRLYHGQNSGTDWLNMSHTNLPYYNGMEVNGMYTLAPCAIFGIEGGWLDYWQLTVYYDVPGSVDLVADGITPSATSIEAGSSFTVNSEGRVTGTGSVGSSFKLGYFLSNDNNVTIADTLLAEQTISTAQDPGDTFGATNLSMSIPAGTTAGTKYLGMIVDSDGDVLEDNETNNVAWQEITVTAPVATEPNLVAVSCSLPDSTAQQGSTVQLTWRARNSGNAATDPFAITYLISTDATLDPATDRLLSKADKPAWASGFDTGDRVKNLQLFPVITAGSYYLGFVMDSDGDVNESDEDDNVCAVPLTIISDDTCITDANNLCLNDGRFKVSADWSDSQGNAGAGNAVQLTNDTGYFWFFNSDNVEVVIKVLDACSINGHYWVFGTGLTNVAVNLTVEDQKTDVEKEYQNPLGQAFSPIQDTSAFASCPK